MFRIRSPHRSYQIGECEGKQESQWYHVYICHIQVVAAVYMPVQDIWIVWKRVLGPSIRPEQQQCDTHGVSWLSKEASTVEGLTSCTDVLEGCCECLTTF